jgi:polysaccharide biosynthesis/export protein
MKAFLFALVVVALSTGCATKGPSFDPRGGNPVSFAPAGLTNQLDPAWLRPPRTPYRLGPGDTIEVELLGDAAGHATLTVGPDGKVYYTLLPGISVWGLTLAETGELIKNELGKFNKTMPEPLVTLRAVGSKRVWMLGTANAGVYTLAAPATLLEAITVMGGVPSAGPDDVIDLKRSFVMRGGKRLPVDFVRLFKSGDMTQNVYLEPEDFVFLRPANLGSIYVMGAVASPSAVPYNSDSTLGRILIRAGGLQKYAQQARVAIVRGGLTDPHIAEVNYQDIITGRATDVPLEPGDIVFVPYTPFRHAARLAEEVIDQFVRTVAVNEGTRTITPDVTAQGSIGVGGFGGIGPPTAPTPATQ